MIDLDKSHIGRTFSGHRIEDACPCPQEPCGLVAQDRVVEGCTQHNVRYAKTIRQGHLANLCPSVTNRNYE